jgi:uncharacterized protein YkwD
MLLLLAIANPFSRVQASRVDGPVLAPLASLKGWALPDAPDGYVYTVQPADTLWHIASAHGTSTADLIAANSLTDPRLLRPGQMLFVPARPSAARKNSSTATAETGAAAAIAPSSDAAPNSDLEVSMLPPEIPALMGLINEKRVAVGLPALVWSPALGQAAQSHAEDCAQRNRGSHTGSDGAPLETRLARTGFSTRWTSENWAYAQNVTHAFTLWWNEAQGRDPHRRNILDPRYDRIGIGIARGPWGTYFVADFASP